MANENPNYYAIIPANVRYNENLSFLEKFLYCEFTALSNCDGYCIAKNKYFAQLYGKDEKTISRAISRLEELGFIRLEYEKTGARVTKRRIYLTDQKSASDKIVNRTEITGDKNITREQEKYLLASDKIVTENNTSYSFIISLILDYFKEKDIEKEKFDWEPLFEKLWKLYPNKKDKILGKSTFEHKIRGLSEKECIEKCNAIYKAQAICVKDWTDYRTEQQFIPRYSSWLNNNIPDSPKFKRGK